MKRLPTVSVPAGMRSRSLTSRALSHQMAFLQLPQFYQWTHLLLVPLPRLCGPGPADPQAWESPHLHCCASAGAGLLPPWKPTVTVGLEPPLPGPDPWVLGQRWLGKVHTEGTREMSDSLTVTWTISAAMGPWCHTALSGIQGPLPPAKRSAACPYLPSSCWMPQSVAFLTAGDTVRAPWVPSLHGLPLPRD